MNQSNNPALNGQAAFRSPEQMASVRQNGRTAISLAPLPSAKWVVVMVVASVIAIAVSGYLGYVSLTSSKIAGCGEGSVFNCGHVTTSQWSLWLGVPVSLLAVGLYVGLLGSLFVGASKRFSDSVRHFGWALVSVFAIAAGMSAIWFISLQVFVLNHLCTYCLAAHACGLVAAAAVIWLKPVGHVSMKMVSSLSVVGVAALVGGQFMTEAPKKYQVEQFEASAAEDAEVFEFEAPFAAPSQTPAVLDVSSQVPSTHQLKQAIAAVLSPASALSSQVSQPAIQQKSDQSAAAATKDEPAERRMVVINGGTVKLDVAQWPVAGSTSAKHMFVEMFDYSCPHCRHTHKAIKSAKEKLGGDLAVVVLPVPLNAACNQTIQVTNPTFAESCEISKLAISVWRVDPKKFTKFHNWMFESEKAPTYAMAKAHAETLVDPQKLSKEMESGVSAKYIAKTVELYKKSGKGNVPKLMFPTTSVVGEFTSADGLVDIIKQQSKQ